MAGDAEKLNVRCDDRIARGWRGRLPVLALNVVIFKLFSTKQQAARALATNTIQTSSAFENCQFDLFGDLDARVGHHVHSSTKNNQYKNISPAIAHADDDIIDS